MTAPVATLTDEEFWAMLEEKFGDEFGVVFERLVQPAMGRAYGQSRSDAAGLIRQLISALGIPRDDYQKGYVNALTAAIDVIV